MCQICECEKQGWRWTDTHGVAQCSTCGTPHAIIHYENDVRVEKAPQILLLPIYIELIKRYWNETKRTIPGGHSFPGGYEMASDEDAAAFYEWMNKNTVEASAVSV